MPPWSRLERVTLHLVQQKRYREVVQFVEAWSRQGAPTLPARLALSEAYVALRLLDRAWGRLRDLVDEGRGPLEAVRLAAELYVLRGWAQRALQLAGVGLRRAPGDPVLERLQKEARAGLPSPEASADPHTSGEMVQLAEIWMARGAFVKAQGWLERARRRELPERTARRADELLWAIRGDFTVAESLEALCDRLAPAPGTVRDGEHTVRTEPAGGAPRRESAEGFRQLFRGFQDDRTEVDAGEPTSVRVMAHDADLRRGEPEPLPDFAEPGGRATDNTEILRVVQKSGSSTPAPAREIPSDPHADYAPGTDLDDDALVVVTRREDTPAPFTRGSGSRGSTAPPAARESSPGGSTPRPTRGPGADRSPASPSARTPGADAGAHAAPPAYGASLRPDKEREKEAREKALRSAHRSARPRSSSPGSSARSAPPRTRLPRPPPEPEDIGQAWPWLAAAGLVLGVSIAVVYLMVTFLTAL